MLQIRSEVIVAAISRVNYANYLAYSAGAIGILAVYSLLIQTVIFTHRNRFAGEFGLDAASSLPTRTFS